MAKASTRKGTLIHDNCTDIAIVGNLYAQHNRDRNPLFKGGARGGGEQLYLQSRRPGHALRGWCPPSGASGRTRPGRWSWWAASWGPGLRHADPCPSCVTTEAAHAKSIWRTIWRSARLTTIPLLEIDSRAALGECRVLDVRPFWSPELVAHPAVEVKSRVLANAGARPWDRDEVDRRIVSEVRNGQGRIIDSEQEVGGVSASQADAAGI